MESIIKVVSIIGDCNEILQNKEIKTAECEKIRDKINTAEEHITELKAYLDFAETPKEETKKGAFLGIKSFAFDFIISFQDYRVYIYKIMIAYLENIVFKKMDK